MKQFIKYFFIVLLAEILLWILILFLKMDGNPHLLRSIGSWLTVLLSLPLSLIHRSYPYWAEGGGIFAIGLTFLTLLIHSLIVFFIAKSIRIQKAKSA